MAVPVGVYLPPSSGRKRGTHASVMARHGSKALHMIGIKMVYVTSDTIAFTVSCQRTEEVASCQSVRGEPQGDYSLS